MSPPEQTRRPTGSRLLAEVLAAEKAERARIVRAVHDGGLQHALAALQELDGVESGDPEAPAALRRDLQEIVLSLRSLTQTADDDSLARLSLTDAVARLAVLAERRGRMTVVAEVDPRAQDVHDELVRDAVRELLTNTIRHARAGRVEVHVRREHDAIVISVADDGLGFSEEAMAEAQRTGHMGVRGLQRTADELGGSLEHGTGLEGRGVRFTLRLPREALVAQESLEEQLQEERRWSAALVSALQDALLVVRNGVLVQVNDAFCRLVELSREELLGVRAHDVTFWGGVESFGAWLTDMQELARGDQRVSLRRPNDMHFDVLSSVARIDDGRGGDIGVLVLLKEVDDWMK